MAYKKTLMVLQSDYPPDIRLAKEIRTLTKNNYRVYVLCNNKSGFPSQEVVDRSTTIIRLRHVSCIGKKLQALVRTPLFFNPIWIWAIVRVTKKYKPDVLHIHDLPLVPLGLFVSKIWDIPIIYDMHENYPEALKVWKPKGVFAFLFQNARLANILDAFCLKRINKIAVVVEEQEENLLSKLVPRDKIHVVTNTEDISCFTKIEINKNILSEHAQYFSILYIGTISVDRGLEVPIQAMPHIITRIPNARLLIVGDGKHKKALQNLAIRKGIEMYVKFIDWVKFKYVPSYIQASKICIVPQPSNPFIDTTIPHKLFQYMTLSKPVIVSDAKPLARVVRECRCGEIFKSHSAEDFTNAVLRVHRSTLNYGENGREAVILKYNWENSSKELLRLYQQISAN